jgi:hypothetical protein
MADSFTKKFWHILKPEDRLKLARLYFDNCGKRFKAPSKDEEGARHEARMEDSKELS